MTLRESLKIALRSLQANKLRSFLTMLGIIIGVASVVTMVAVGSGAQTKVREQIRSLGANVLMVQPGAARQGRTRQESGSGHTLTEDDAAAIGRLPVIAAAAPAVWGSGIQIVYGNRNWRTRVYGTVRDYFVVREWAVAAGRYFSAAEEERAGKVVIIGNTVAEGVFGDEDPVGKTIRILSVPFTVIGVLRAKGLSGTGRDQDDAVLIPLSTAKLRLMGAAHQVNREAVQYVIVKARSNAQLEAAEQQMRGLLRQRHRLPPDAEDDFRIRDPAAAAEAQRASTRTIAWLLAAIASISLVVGGISIMNIMLVSVSERTREIGVRLAVGARRRDIRDQFLIEALSLCLLGGLAGLAIGTGIAVAVARLAGWPILLSPGAMLAAVGFSAIVGIFFGYYPARRAAGLDPITCLRTE